MPSMPSITPPIKDTTGIKLLTPTKKRNNGGKQVSSQAKFLFILRSYQKIFFKVSPKAIKEVKVATIPKRNPKDIILLSKKFCSPTKADSVVSEPETPRTK